MKICKHFSECGGCRFQDISYKDQLLSKEDRLRGLARSYGISTELKPINYSQQWYYRNKMEFTFSGTGEITCGLYSKKVKRKVVDIEECLIFSPDAGKILKSIKEFAGQKGYSVYNKYSHQGFLRHLIIREAKFTKEIMVGIVTSSAEKLDKNRFVKMLTALELQSAVKSIYWIVNDSFSDAVVFEKKELLYGEGFIREKLDGLVFKIGIDTFFQVNPHMTADFYMKIRNYTSGNTNKRVLDLFCGAGSIGIFLAQEAKFVWGVEIGEEIVDMAWQNARANNIENISFFVSDARRFLNTQGAFYKNIDLLIVNPPRSGLSNKVKRAILRLTPGIILYSSCNPDAFFRDLDSFLCDYTLDFIEPFDFFPHTPHFECLTLLKPKN